MFFDSFGWVGHISWFGCDGEPCVLEFQFPYQVRHAVGSIMVFSKADAVDCDLVPGLLFLDMEGAGVGCLDTLGNSCLGEFEVVVLESVSGVQSHVSLLVP